MHFDDLLATPAGGPVTVAVAAPEEPDVVSAVMEAVRRGYVDPIMVGNPGRIRDAAAEAGEDISRCRLEPVGDPATTALRAAQLVSDGEAAVLMKGLVETAVLLKAVLDPEVGLRTGTLLSHLALFQVPGFNRLIAVTDAAMNIAPDLGAKREILRNAVFFLHALGVECPRVAVLAAKESVNPKMSATVDAAALAQENLQGEITGCIVGGPLALDNAISPEAARTKGIDSPVAGVADILVVPTIEAGNILYKALAFMTQSVHAGVILGARAPIVLTSRADSREAKLNSIIVAARSCR